MPLGFPAFGKADPKKNYSTPWDFFNPLNEEFDFEIDVAASAENTKIPDRFWTIEDDALKQDWAGLRCWANPPWGKLSRWLRKAYEESLKGAVIVMLCPIYCNTEAWRECVTGKAEIRLLPHKITFEGYNSWFPQALCLLIWQPKNAYQRGGSKGGLACAARMTPEARKERSRLANEAKKAKRQLLVMLPNTDGHCRTMPTRT